MLEGSCSHFRPGSRLRAGLDGPAARLRESPSESCVSERRETPCLFPAQPCPWNPPSLQLPKARASLVLLPDSSGAGKVLERPQLQQGVPSFHFPRSSVCGQWGFFGRALGITGLAPFPGGFCQPGESAGLLPVHGEDRPGYSRLLRDAGGEKASPA